MRYALFALALVLPTSHALAATVPVGGEADARVRYVQYNPEQVYTVYGRFRQALEIEFAPGEAIQQAALGDTISWEIAPVGNIIFLKPREKAATTNLIVLTNVGGQTRSYRFELVMNGGPSMYSIKFRYAKEEADRARTMQVVRRLQAARAAEQAVVKSALDQAVVQGKRNLNYWLQGDSALAPSEVSDNGEFTVMRFPGHEEIPAIFGVNPDGKEAIIDYDVREDYVVIHGIYKTMRLRKGQSVLCITDGSAIPTGRLERTGTVSPIIERTVKPGVRAANGDAIPDRGDSAPQQQQRPQGQQRQIQQQVQPDGEDQ